MNIKTLPGIRTNTLSPGDEILGLVEKLVFQGKGLIRHEGFVIFVYDVIPGENVLVKITKVKKNFAEATLLKVIEKSKDRIEPMCSHFGICGGCHLQHINPSCFSSIKRSWLQESLAPYIPKDLPFEVLPTEQILSFRRKITLHARLIKDTWTLGYWARDNTTLIPITECPIFFDPSEKHILSELSSLLRELPGESYELVLLRLEESTEEGEPFSFALILKGETYVPHHERDQVISSLRKRSFLASFLIRLPTWNFDQNNTIHFLETLGGKFPFSLEAFIQNHPQQSEKLYSDQIGIITSTLKKYIIFDLYAGVAIPGKVMAKMGHTVKACELSREAVKVATQDRIANFSIECGPVETVVRKWKEEADLWIVNPPRQGLSKEALELVIDKKPKQLVYVSCNPTTLRRDLAPLLQAGWKIFWLRGYDMFPQSYHFETMILLKIT